MRSSQNKAGPVPYSCCPYKKRKLAHRHRDKWSCDNRGTEQSDAAISQGQPSIASNHQKLRRENDPA